MSDPYNRPILTDGRVTVRPPKSTDVHARLALGVSPEILRMYGTILPKKGVSYNEKAARAWVERQMNDPLGFCIDKDGALVGALRIHSLDEQDARASIGIGLLDDTRLSQGIGTAALRLILKHAFTTMGLHRISLRALEYNARAIAAYRKVGFVEEGLLRESCKVGDEWHNDVMMGLLAQEFIL